MIVIDIGCHTHAHRPDHDSILALVERFRPEILFGFDPHPDMEEGLVTVQKTVVLRRRVAAWTDGGINLPVKVDGLSTAIDPAGEARTRCFDLALWIALLPRRTTIILKIDAEGSEYPLLSHIAVRGVDEILDRVLVEWHEKEQSHGLYGPRPNLRCPVEEWE